MPRITPLLFAALLALAAAPSSARPDAPPRLVHTSSDPFQCKACAKPLGKALAFLDRREVREGAAFRPHWGFFLGWLYLVDGRHPEDLQGVIEAMGTLRVRSLPDGRGLAPGGNENWHVAMCALFLSEIYGREPSDVLKARLLDILRIAGERVEPTGGWNHTKGFAATQPGYASDLASITVMMYAAMLNLRSAGVEVPEKLLAAAQKNLESLSDGLGFSYGTGNPVPDHSMCRGAWAWLGLSKNPAACPKAFRSIPTGLRTRAKTVLNGHAFVPLHFAAAALANHLVGKADYDRFFQHWGDRLIALQKEDGSVELPYEEIGQVSGKPLTQAGDGFVSSTAAFALVLLLQHPGAFEKGSLAPKPEPWLGLRLGAEGAVEEVVEGSPAFKAGVLPGDRIQALDGKPAGDLKAIRERMKGIPPGRKLALEILRGAGKLEVQGVAGKAPRTRVVKENEF